jgi:hypothetical protein
MHRRDLIRRRKDEPALLYDEALSISRQPEAYTHQRCRVSLLQTLPNEILLELVGYLPAVDTLSLCVTSKQLQSLCNA